MFVKRESTKLGIYIHFPFCIQKCYYCDFYSLPINQNANDVLDLFVKRIQEELKFRYKEFQNFSEVNTIYFGGGTASFLSAKHLKKILSEIQNYFKLCKNCEITLEGNPEHLYSTEYLLSLKEVHINRISLGFQTSQFKFLETMNRYYQRKHYEKVLSNISQTFENWNIDLIYGFPDQKLQDFWDDLRYCLSFQPKHISCYSLTLERNTLYFKKAKEKSLKEPNYKLQEIIFQKLPNYLKKFGFYPYEVSNYSQKKFYCRHNLRYWLYEPYLGLGPSAHSFNGMYRFQNPKNWQKWIQNFSNHSTKSDPLKEIPITLFRLKIPINHQWIRETLKESSEFVFEFFLKMEKKGFGKNIQKNNYFIWNQKGISMLDTLILEFYNDLDSILKSKINKTSS